MGYYGEAIINAAQNGSLELIKYLESALNETEKRGLTSSNSTAFGTACFHGHLDIVKYFIEDSEINKYINPHLNNDGFDSACFKGHLNIVKYLSKFILINNHQQAFLMACNGNQWDVVHYLIFDLKVKNDELLNDWLTKNNLENVQRMFESRDLIDKLNNELPVDNIEKNKKKKI